MSETTNISEVRSIVKSPKWPRSVEEFPRELDTNCIEFALDLPNFDFSPIVGRGVYDKVDASKNLMRFFNKIDLSPRQIDHPDKKDPNEYVIIVYEYKYMIYDKFQGCSFWHNEVHLARVELDGTVVEKPSAEDSIHITTLEELNSIIAADAAMDEDYTGPTYIAIRKPQ